MDATPTSKKRRYHGVDYCFSDNDSSLDSKLTKIQNRYLISERASHCSTVSTPRDLRLIREARKRKTGLRAKSRRVKSDGTNQSSGAASSIQEQEMGVAEARKQKEGLPMTKLERTNQSLGAASSTQERERGVAETRKRKAGLRMRFDETKLEGTNQSLLPDTSSPHATSATQEPEQNSTKRRTELKENTSTTNQEQEKGVAVGGVSLKDKGKGKFPQNSRALQLRKKKGRTELVQNGESQTSGVGKEEAVKREGRKKRALDLEGESSSQNREETETGKTTRRNSTSSFYGKKASTPKQNSVAASQKVVEGTTQEGVTQEEDRGKERLREYVEDSDQSQSSSSECRRKRKPLKTLLGEAVVNALKKNGMPRDHQNFRACYNRLFNLSKSFMEVRGTMIT